MRLNTLQPAEGAKKPKKRVGRGIGSGLGKTAGRGHKGQASRAGGDHKVGFEGGQMPIQRRLPKFGFVSRQSLLRNEIRLNELNHVTADVINLQTLKDAGLLTKKTEYVKIILSGELSKAVHVKGIKATKGAREAILAAGGSVEE